MTDTSTQRAFKRLLYVGDVPVESTLAGSALLYRLLSDWPGDRLRIMQGTLESKPETRLKGVSYVELSIVNARWLFSRFTAAYRSWLLKTAALHGGRIVSEAKQFGAEGILTVCHGYLWLAAARAAGRLGIPLHLVLHDDPVVTMMLPKRLERAAGEKFAAIYRQAASRWCVSPYMAEAYERKYGVAGQVLYPSRASGAPEFDTPPMRPMSDHGITFGYAGSVSTPSYGQSLADLSAAALAHGDRVLIHTNLAPEALEGFFLAEPHVEAGPIIPFRQLIDILRAKADVLYVPMSFEPSERANMELSFPSKLTDYTAVGLPLLIRGPEYCSAVRWATQNPGAAMIVTDPSVLALAKAMEELASPQLRNSLAVKAIELGRKFFGHEQATAQFLRVVAGVEPREPAGETRMLP